MLLTMSSVAFAQNGITMELWPNGAPNTSIDQNDKAELTVYLPDEKKATGRAVVCCPGGGYGFLAMDHEGFTGPLHVVRDVSRRQIGKERFCLIPCVGIWFGRIHCFQKRRQCNVSDNNSFWGICEDSDVGSDGHRRNQRTHGAKRGSLRFRFLVKAEQALRPKPDRKIPAQFPCNTVCVERR